MELTEQDRAILNMLGQGYTTPQIARSLGYKEDTIRNRLRQLFRLYKVKNRTQLMVQAIRC